MKAVIGLLLKFLSRSARPYLQSYGLLRVKKVFNRSALEWTPAGERVVVLAPHMDDEVIGCGGTLARHVTCGADVTVVFLTDGRQGINPDKRAGEHADVAGTRKLEARRALQELGIAKIEFLDGEDGRLGADPGVAVALRSLLETLRPDLVYLPFFLEEHPDHRAASSILADAVRGTSLAFRCHGYEVWTPLFPNCLVRIDQTIEAKRRSLAHYQSQLSEADYLHTSLGLNAYRSSTLLDRTCRFAEAFYAVSLPQYLQALRDYTLSSAPSTEPSP